VEVNEYTVKVNLERLQESTTTYTVTDASAFLASDGEDPIIIG